MDFGLYTCAKVKFKRGGIVKTHSIDHDCVKNIRALGQEEAYKYIAVSKEMEYSLFK